MSRVTGAPGWTQAEPRWVLATATLATAALSPALSILGTNDVNPARYPVIPAALGVALAALQLRHSFAAAKGTRPSHWQWTLLALALFVYAPLRWFTYDWVATQPLLMASALMLLRRRLAIAVAALPVITTAGGLAAYQAGRGAPAMTVEWDLAWWSSGLILLTAVPYGATWLSRSADELRAARAGLARVAVEQERLWLSRDLHDLLGQSLSAVSLKGDLAAQLLPDDPAGARAEIEALTTVAQDALHGIRAIIRDKHPIDLRTELAGAAALLAAAGVAADFDVTDQVPGYAEDVFAWVVREGVTNILRHSEASTCSISIHRRSGRAVLRIANDGASGVSGTGTGIAGCAGRAEAVSGHLSWRLTQDGEFLLTIDIPVEPT